MKTRRKLAAAVSSLAMAAIVLLTGCGNSAESSVPAAEETAAGAIILSVNPEIRVEYDREGLVTEITGANDDGKAIVASYPDYIGKDCQTVLNELVAEINEAGYFVDEIDGNKKNIVIQLEPGSLLPSESFLTDISTGAQGAVKELKLGSGIVTISDDDYDDAYEKDGQPSKYITLAKAQEIALTQAGVKAADAKFEDKEFDHDDGTPVFELEFTAGGVEYDYDVHAVTGKVIKAQHEKVKTSASSSSSSSSGGGSSSGQSTAGFGSYNDTDYGPGNDGVTDYNDTDYGPNNDGVTDYNNTDYGPNNDGVTDYNSGSSGNSGYGNSGYSNSGYDGGDSGYDD